MYVLPYPGGRLEVGPHGKLYESLDGTQKKHIATVTPVTVVVPDTAWTKKFMSLMGFEQDSLTKALPLIVGGIIAVVAYNFATKR